MDHDVDTDNQTKSISKLSGYASFQAGCTS